VRQSVAARGRAPRRDARRTLRSRRGRTHRARLTFMNWYRYSSPATFYPLAGKLIPWFGWAAAVLTIVGLWIGLVTAPTDFQQGDAYRIIFIHVPTAWMSMFLYLVMALWSAFALA